MSAANGEGAVAQANAKLDPETLAIRARPPRAIRFKRGVIVAAAACLSVSLIAVTWMALKPRLFERGETQPELSQPNVRAGEALSGAPATYGDVPRLGPPLPGDLGKPILERQQQLAAASNPADQQLQQADAAEQERRLAELRAARESGLLVEGRRGGAALELAPTDPAAPSNHPATLPMPPDPLRDRNAQDRKAAFVATLDPRGDVNPHRLNPLPSPYTLMAGSVIAASLITGLNSELPGLVTALVTENAYDSATGRILLVPQGARLVGSYDSVVAFGQRRALIVWQRIILPDGSSLRIDNVPATDAAGFAGLADKVDFHTWALLKGVALATLLGVGAELTVTAESDLVEAIRESTQQNVARAGDQITQRNLDIQPTIRIRPGTPVRLVVHKDLVLASWKGGGSL